jgi:hypothetical protein
MTGPYRKLRSAAEKSTTQSIKCLVWLLELRHSC